VAGKTPREKAEQLRKKAGSGGCSTASKSAKEPALIGCCLENAVRMEWGKENGEKTKLGPPGLPGGEREQCPPFRSTGVKSMRVRGVVPEKMGKRSQRVHG